MNISAQGDVMESHDGRVRSHPQLDAEERLAPIPRPGWWDLHQRSRPGRSRFRVRTHNRRPPEPSCFSRPICRLAMLLNDSASSKERQLLLPFVTRLACADRPEIEKEREVYIQAQMPKGRL